MFPPQGSSVILFYRTISCNRLRQPGLSSTAVLLWYAFIWTSQLKPRKRVLTEEKPISGYSSCDVHMPSPYVAHSMMWANLSPPQIGTAVMFGLNRPAYRNGVYTYYKDSLSR